MGNKTGNQLNHQTTRTRPKNSYSFNAGDFSQQNINKIYPTNFKASIYRNNTSSLDLKITTQQASRYQSKDLIDQLSLAYISKQKSPKVINPKEQNIKLERLTKNNDQLRKQLITISRQLSQQLQKKKTTTLLPQHANKQKKILQKSSINDTKQSRQIDKKQNDKKQSKQVQKKNKFKIIALKKQLQNGYLQISRYKKQIQQLKKSYSSTNQSETKLQTFQDKIKHLDKQIIQKQKQILSIKQIVTKQKITINQAEDSMNSSEINQIKKDIIQLKQQLKNYKQIQYKRDKDDKMKHQVLIQLQRKLRQVNGDYLPDFRNFSIQGKQKIQERADNNSLKESQVKKRKSNNLPKQKQFRYVPSALQIQQVQKKLSFQKQIHEQFNLKIQLTLRKKHQLHEQTTKINTKLQSLQKQYQSLLYKKQRYMQLVMGNISMGDVADDQMLSIQEGQIGTVLKGESLLNQNLFQDHTIFKVSQHLQNFKIVNVNVWQNTKAQIVGIQFYYTDGKQFIIGKRTPQNKEIQEKKIMELQQGDHLKNVMGIFHPKTKFLQFLVFQSFKGKIFKFGKQTLKGTNFNLGVSKKQKVSVVTGACTFDGSFWRINKLGFQIFSL